MVRAVLAIIAGFVVWVAAVTLLNFGLRYGLPGYVEAEPVFGFTLAMLIARLVESALATISAGAVARLIAPASRVTPWVLGVLLLALFIPVHLSLWTKFPIWYHLAFLLSLLPLTLLGAALVKRRAAR